MTRDAAIFFVRMQNSVVIAQPEALQFFGRAKNFLSKRPAAQPFFGRAKNPVVMALPEALPFFSANK